MRFVFFLFLLFSAQVAAKQTRKEVPRQFRGEWNMNLADCGTALNDSVLVLHASKIKYYESEGPLRGVVTKGPELALIAEVTGEGETRVHAAHYRLSRDGRSLTDMLSTPALKRHRCPIRAR